LSSWAKSNSNLLIDARETGVLDQRGVAPGKLEIVITCVLVGTHAETFVLNCNVLDRDSPSGDAGLAAQNAWMGFNSLIEGFGRA